jgi:hypothetical protein
VGAKFVLKNITTFLRSVRSAFICVDLRILYVPSKPPPHVLHSPRRCDELTRKKAAGCTACSARGGGRENASFRLEVASSKPKSTLESAAATQEAAARQDTTSKAASLPQAKSPRSAAAQSN